MLVGSWVVAHSSKKQSREKRKCKTKAKRGLWPAGSSALTLLATSNPPTVQN